MSETPAPAPRPLAALLLTALAWSLFVVTTGLATPSAGGSFGLALGLLLGFGGVGTLAARSVPPPADRRIGLSGFAPRLLLPLLLLTPVVLLLSELDNGVAAWLFAGEKPPTAELSLSALDTLEWVLFAVLLRPVLEEFFFRGVVQQGVVAVLGQSRGLLYAAFLFTLVRASLFGADAYHATSFGAQALCLGLLLGFLRLATGSILPGALLSMATEAAGVLSLQLEDALAIPGFNAPGAHTPLTWLVPAALAVGIGVLLLSRESRARRDG